MNENQAQGRNLRRFNDWPVALKLTAGFGAVILCIVVMVYIIFNKLDQQETLQNQVIELRMPTNVAGHDLVNGINRSLAALRGYMVLGNEQFKTERQLAWDEIDSNMAVMETMSKNWTNSQNVNLLNEITQLMAEFRQAQLQIENVTNTPEEQPGLKLLQQDAAPLANKIMQNVTELIDEEKLQPASAERKALLSNLADSRGSFAMGLASIRAYLLSGDEKWTDQFHSFWQKNSAALSKLDQQVNLFSVNQRQVFNQYRQNRQDFSALPQRMFSIRASERWNEANYLLATEAAPRAAKLLTLLQNMVEDQNELVKVDAQALQDGSSALKMTAIVATLIAIGVAVFIAWIITGMITNPLNTAISLSNAISAGNLDNHIDKTANDETGQLLDAIGQMQSTLKQQAIENNDYIAQVQAVGKSQAIIEFDLQGTILTANDNFLKTLGYTLEQIQGKHHSMFVEPQEKASEAYKQFWQSLAKGEFKSGEFKRLDREGNEIWIRATYNPIVDLDGNPYKVVKFATDITVEKLQAVENQKVANQSSALKLCNANVMLADNDLTICYMNNGMLQMLKDSEATIRQQLPQFNTNTLIGTNADIFHKNVDHQRGIVSSLAKTEKSRIKVAGLTFELTMSPWTDPQGKRLGTVIEWYDLTEELAKREKEEAIAAANARVKTALDKCQANVMMADNDLNIIYTNESVQNMMQANESRLRQALPNFNAQALVGTCVDDFHANPSHQRSMIANLKTSYQTKLKVADLTFDLVASPIFGDNGERLGTVVEWEDITEKLATEEKEQALAAANARIKLALDTCQANVMMADNDLNIIYLNDSVQQMMEKNESTLKTALPSFNVSKLIGTCVDDFHKNPKHQRDMLKQLTEPYHTRLPVAGLTFDLIATPILDENGERLGTVVEWDDITERLAAEEKEQALAAANARVKVALDKCQANVMMADNDLNIIYTNDSVQQMMQSNEARLRKALPNFNAQALVGTCVDDFHANPSHQRSMITNLTQPYQTKLKVADLTFNLVASPIFDDDGERLGTVVEWDDITDALAAEEKEQALAAANARVKIALDKCQANVMMADTDLNIIYLNDSVAQMMSKNEAVLQTALPNFRADKLIGTCVDDFHKKPAHQRGMLEKLTEAYNTRLPIAGLTFDLIATPIYNDDGSRLGTVVEWSDITESLAAQKKEQALAAENARIKQALDNVSTNTMIADGDNEIIYMNEAIHHMMQVAESDIQAVLPDFNAKNLMGQKMDAFHKNPAHQTGLIERLEQTYKTEIKVGVRTFGLIANPILDEKNTRIGTVVEWNDRTEEVAIEQEIANLISSAGDGDLTSRIEEAGKTGFFLNLAGGLNQLVGIAEGVINETVEMLDAMAHGNLTKRIESAYKGAFDKLKSDANSTAEKLTEIITRINNSSSAVASGAEEIAQGNTDLSQRTEEQASSLEETASSMEQMTSTVRQNADNAKVANDLAADATTKAQKGGDVVKRAVDSMSEINESSKKIADIIGVIDEIAFQTNLLALNAAVEAARAGEQGRGFAVVAGEVRNLAQRSAAAAKEIKDLIRDSVSKVQDGSQLVNESGATLNEIVDAISRVTAMIADISSASTEQSEGIEQVNKAITQMDEMTQQNAALVEQASAAGEAMADQARSMRQILGFFTTDSSKGGGDAPLLMPPAAEPEAVSQSQSSQAPSAIGHSMDFSDDDEEWEEF